MPNRICAYCEFDFTGPAILTVLDQFYCSERCYQLGRDYSKHAVNHYPSILAAARAVVEAWEALTYELPGTIDDPIVARMDALRAAVEAADH